MGPGAQSVDPAGEVGGLVEGLVEQGLRMKKRAGFLDTWSGGRLCQRPPVPVLRMQNWVLVSPRPGECEPLKKTIKAWF